MAIVLGVVLASAGVLGLGVVDLVGVALTLGIWGLLRFRYKRRRDAWSIDEAYSAPQLREQAVAVQSAVEERRRLDRLVDVSAVSAAAAGLLGGAAGAIAGVDPPGEFAGHAAGTAALIGSGGVFWSSMVDWYWVLPRISGLLGHRSCRAAPEPGAPGISWEEVTRWWLIHRTIAAVAVAVCGGGLLGTLTGLGARSLDATPAVQGMIGVLTAVVATFAEVYRKKAAHGLPLFLHPEIVVGESYRDAEAGDCLPVDVAMEGFKIVKPEAQKARYLAYRAQGTTRFLRAKGDTTVPLGGAQARRVGTADVACGPCLGFNWYCVENPHAWDKGPRSN
jgi:hypothetical protein